MIGEKMNSKGMELPIAVMVVFFVSIAVALIVINFAGQLIGMGQTELRKFTIGSEKADFFVETYAVTGSTVATLASQCYKDNLGKYGGDKICYILHQLDKEAPIALDQVAASEQFYTLIAEDPATATEEKISFEEMDGSGRTIYIRFAEITQSIAVES
ncbi:MAG: hypothetical protein Q8N60_04625 [Candidatus Diapherotrites archaeon]|nr:hypothetical protein [Candidatus Diapherotrites archaeon]